MIIDKNISRMDKRLFNNTAFLYVMTFSTQLLNLLTVPYLTRVLGPIIYGKIGLAVAYMMYVQLLLDFGFILSATREIAENREDTKFASELITSVTLVKLLLSLLIVGILFAMRSLKIIQKDDMNLFVLYFGAYLLNALLPDYFYRGIEDMKTITIRTVIIRSIFTILIFFFVKERNDYCFVPFSLFIGNVMALFLSYYDIYKNHNIRFYLPTYNQVKNITSVTLPFFISRISTTFYQALNVVILGKVYGSSPIIGYYSSSDKIISLVKTGASPIADSLYPYMVQNRNYKLIKKILLILMPLISFGVITIGVFAESICIFLFGSEYAKAGDILRLLLPIAWIILPSYILSFPVLTPMGLSKYANLSNVFGMCVQLILLCIIIFLGKLNIFTLCALTSCTEVAVFLFRIAVVIKNRKKVLNDLHI